MQVNDMIRFKVMQLREQHGFSQSDLASAIGISRSHMNKLENGTLQMSLVYIKQIAEVFDVSLDSFFDSSDTKKMVLPFDFDGVNAGIKELALSYLAEGENYFTESYETLLVTEEKLMTWKHNAKAGSLIIGSVACRYLIVADSKPDPKRKGYLLTRYGFINVDHAGWTLCSTWFDSCGELIEWFASNIENPIVDVLSNRQVESTLPGHDHI